MGSSESVKRADERSASAESGGRPCLSGEGGCERGRPDVRKSPRGSPEGETERERERSDLLDQIGQAQRVLVLLRQARHVVMVPLVVVLVVVPVPCRRQEPLRDGGVGGGGVRPVESSPQREPGTAKRSSRRGSRRGAHAPPWPCADASHLGIVRSQAGPSVWGNRMAEAVVDTEGGIRAKKDVMVERGKYRSWSFTEM